MISYDSQDKTLFFILLFTFIITEIIDDIFDHLLGSSVIHSIIQLLLFLLLFIIVAKIFMKYHKSKVNRLIPDELMDILKTIHSENSKGILINQAKLMKALDITKPTIKKRLNQLYYFHYIRAEEKGNNKYLTLTRLGKSLIR